MKPEGTRNKKKEKKKHNIYHHYHFINMVADLYVKILHYYHFTYTIIIVS